MFWLDAFVGVTGRLNTLRVAVIVMCALLLHGAAYFVLSQASASGKGLPPNLHMAATAALVVIATFMFSSGLKYSVNSLFERQDLDLLLSSPLPSRSVFTTRLAAMVLGVSTIYLLLAAPIADAGLMLGQWRWLGLYVSILFCAAVWMSLAMLLTLLMVRLIGARRTRTVAQVISAVAGALLFLLSQAQTFLRPNARAESAQWLQRMLAPEGALGNDSVLWWPGRAALGESVPLLGMMVLGMLAFFLTVHFAHRFFVRGLQQAVSKVRVAPARGRETAAFGRHLAELVIRKEWRLIMRDTQLLSEVLLQLLYLVPLAFVLLRSESAALPGLAAAMTVLAASLAASLTWVVVSAEDAPDLLLTSPANLRLVRLAKVAAACAPPLLLMLVPLLWVLWRSPLAGLLMSFSVVAAILCAACISSWHGQPAQRSAFRKRAKGRFLSGLLEGISSFGWAGMAYFLIAMVVGGVPVGHPLFAALGLTLALLTIVLAWLTRRRDGVGRARVRG